MPDWFGNTFQQGFAGQSYGQWLMFLVLFVFMWGMALSLNALVRRGTSNVL